MRTRFAKVWCPECKTMQFGGECGHSRVVRPPWTLQLGAALFEKPLGSRFGKVGRKVGELILGPITETKLHRVVSAADGPVDVNHSVHPTRAKVTIGFVPDTYAPADDQLVVDVQHLRRVAGTP